ncbi:S2-RNase [Pyrus ussuriensis x Pyrus communis]|uniref:S2-RNase n=1 Tax=Pyrus ussuriensis x Pyrus communis TaxID=2448454 RepID=A0A5N5IHG3_9ROSA|nr:S2-RNase [Pyrus ussuriensis x Pyrus communis]
MLIAIGTNTRQHHLCRHDHHHPITTIELQLSDSHSTVANNTRHHLCRCNHHHRITTVEGTATTSGPILLPTIIPLKFR